LGLWLVLVFISINSIQFGKKIDIKVLKMTNHGLQGLQDMGFPPLLAWAPKEQGDVCQLPKTQTSENSRFYLKEIIRFSGFMYEIALKNSNIYIFSLCIVLRWRCLDWVVLTGCCLGRVVLGVEWITAAMAVHQPADIFLWLLSVFKLKRFCSMRKKTFAEELLVFRRWSWQNKLGRKQTSAIWTAYRRIANHLKAYSAQILSSFLKGRNLS